MELLHVGLSSNHHEIQCIETDFILKKTTRIDRQANYFAALIKTYMSNTLSSFLVQMQINCDVIRLCGSLL